MLLLICKHAKGHMQFLVRTTPTPFCSCGLTWPGPEAGLSRAKVACCGQSCLASAVRLNHVAGGGMGWFRAIPMLDQSSLAFFQAFPWLCFMVFGQ